MNSPIKNTLLVSLVIALLLFASPMTFAQELIPGTPDPANSSASINLYLPTILKTLDLSVDFVEITQAVQTNTNSVTLVANRNTAARVYIAASSAQSIDGVYVSMSAYKGAVQLSGSPMVLGPKNVQTSWSRANINSSFNTLLPSTWLSDSVTLYVTVDPSGLINEQNESNNTVSKTLNFTEVPDLEVKVVPIRYTHNPTGKTYPPPSSSFIKAAFERFYPMASVNVTVRNETYNFSGDLSKYGSWSRLLDIITAMKAYDEAPDSQVYYGLVPLLDNNGFTWWTGGYAGLGWIGYRESIGLTEAYLKQYDYYYVDGKFAATHEVGHNFGRDHSPCDVTSGIDNNYPYAGGIIGQYGFDLSAWQVIPPSNKDIMSYCNPYWISDYTYLGLLQNQLVFGVPAKAVLAGESLYIRATILEDGSAELQPIYSIPSAPDETLDESEYSLEFIDENGGIVASHHIVDRLADGDNFQSRAIHTKIPIPDLPYSSVRLLKNGMMVSQRTISSVSRLKSDQPKAYLENNEFVLNWGYPQTPALIRYTTDQGKTWITLGVDLLEGELRIDPQSLPSGSLLFEIRLADTTETTLQTTWEHIP